MKRMPVTLRIPTIVVALGLLSLCLCTMQDDEISRSNPCDPGGDNWTRDGIPVLHSVELDSTPLWSDFDFDNSTGSIEAVIHASDPNESYDTLGFRVFLGRSRESLDTVSASRDSFFTFTGLSPAETYHYRIEVFDTWDSMAVHTGRFVTPSGLPPRPPKSVSISPRTRSIRISWHVLSTDPAGRYRLYGNTSPRTAPFRLVLDTLVPLSSSVVSYSDYVDDYEPHYYVVAARNEYGESRCKDTLFSRCYKSGFSVPYDIQASLNGCRLVDLRWKLATSSSAVGFDIYRRRESSSYYRYVGRVPVSEETDFYTWYTYADTPATPGASYYRVAAVFDGGIPSKMSGDSAIARASLSAPYDVRATDGTYTHFVRLTWIAREGASGYGIYRSAGSCWSSGSETMVPVGTTDTTFYDDSVPAADSSYCYRVAAIDSCGHPGTRSSPVSGQRVSLKAPAHFTASDGTYANYVALTWNSVTGAHLRAT